MRHSKVWVGLMVMSTMIMGSGAHAVTFTLGNVPQSDQQNVLYQPRQTGTEIFGRTNQTDTSVLFSSDESLLTPAQGQATLTAADGIINEVRISVPDGTYRSLIINPFLGGGPGSASPGSLDVSVDTTSGTTPFTYTLGRGENFLTITAEESEPIVTTTLSSTTGFADLRQVRIGGLELGDNGPGNGNGDGGGLPQFAPTGTTAINGAVIPEPNTLLLLASALSAFVLWRICDERWTEREAEKAAPRGQYRVEVRKA